MPAAHRFKVEVEVNVRVHHHIGTSLEHHKARRVVVEAVASALRLKVNQGREDDGLIGSAITHIEQLD